MSYEIADCWKNAILQVAYFLNDKIIVIARNMKFCMVSHKVQSWNFYYFYWPDWLVPWMYDIINSYADDNTSHSCAEDVLKAQSQIWDNFWQLRAL